MCFVEHNGEKSLRIILAAFFLSTEIEKDTEVSTSVPVFMRNGGSYIQSLDTIYCDIAVAPFAIIIVNIRMFS